MHTYKAFCKGNRSGASRLGDSKSGASAYVKGRRIGVKVSAEKDAYGHDVFTVERIPGPLKFSTPKVLLKFTEKMAYSDDHI